MFKQSLFDTDLAVRRKQLSMSYKELSERSGVPISTVKRVLGNGFNGAAFETVQSIASQMTYFDLMGNQKYMEEFMSANFLPHTNLDEFPSVQEELSVLNT